VSEFFLSITAMEDLDAIAYALVCDEWDEEAHQRDNNGRFGTGGITGERIGKGKESKVEWKTANGEAVPGHIQDLLKAAGVAPGYRDIWVNHDPAGALLAVGRGPNGLRKMFYSDNHKGQQAAEKFERAKEFAAAVPSLAAQINKDVKKGNDSAACLRLCLATGFRIGNEGNETKHKEHDKETSHVLSVTSISTYGASTLRGEHISVKGDTIKFNFHGKDGVHIEHELKDRVLAEHLRDKAGKDVPLFKTSAAKVADYLKKTSGNEHFKPKDARTYVANKVAVAALGDRKAHTEKDFQKLKMDVAKAVASELHNTPSVALHEYINPSVFAQAGNF
jgi:DNA topoisomerase-1